MQHRSFHAMGTTVEAFVESDHDASTELAAVEAEFERLEQVMSRFRPDSELMRLNDAGVGRVSADLADVVERALDARERTHGRFDPTVHDAVVAAGYDRTFDELPADRTASRTEARCGGHVVVTGRFVAIEKGFRLDLGGIGKGYAAERAADLLAPAGPALVSAGGDIALRGLPATGAWAVAVDETLTVGVAGGGVATSGSDRRRWRMDGAAVHHLIDPGTGVPSHSDLLRVTVFAPDAVEAEVLAKVLFLGGTTAAVAAGVPAVLVTADGRTVMTGGL